MKDKLVFNCTFVWTKVPKTIGKGAYAPFQTYPRKGYLTLDGSPHLDFILPYAARNGSRTVYAYKQQFNTNTELPYGSSFFD